MTLPLDDLNAPELSLLGTLLGQETATKLAKQPGGWRTLSIHEVEALALNGQGKAILALQQLIRQGYPELPRHRFTRSDHVAAVYERRIGDLDREVMVAVALDGRMNVLAELEIASGGHHGIAVTPSDVFRPLIRSGASAFVLLHNHPSGDPSPSQEDVAMTQALLTVSQIVGVELVDHIVVAARGGGWSSLADLGLMGDEREKGSSDQTVSA
ncbi:MAG: JAB domain-containing protein [Polyangiaceae bacterium]